MNEELENLSSGPLTRVELLIVVAVILVLATITSSTLFRIHTSPSVSSSQPADKFTLPPKAHKPGTLPLGSNGLEAGEAELTPNVWRGADSNGVSQEAGPVTGPLPGKVDLGLDLGKGVVPPSPWLVPGVMQRLVPSRAATNNPPSER